MRILVSGGGTGGHVYPILTVVDALQKDPSPSPATGANVKRHRARPSTAIEILYAGTPDGVEAQMAAEAGIDFAPIYAGQLRIRNPFKLTRNSVQLLQGGWQARSLMRRWRPHVIFVTGGYVCAPIVWAASRSSIPILIYLPDMTPGLAIQRLAPYASQIAVSFPEVAAYFPGKAIVTGYPVRQTVQRRQWSKAEARKRLQLQQDLPTVLIFGGSRGARDINIATATMLPDLLSQAQLIHITGTLDWPTAQQRTPRLTLEQQARYMAQPYLHEEMSLALHAADLVVARAGASTLGEFPAMALPSILVPLPISGGHQYPNAAYLSERGAAKIVENDAMSEALWPSIQSLLNNPNRLAEMSAASADLAQPDGARRIAEAILRLATAEPTHD